MPDEMSFPVGLSERERFTLVMFFTDTHKPQSRADRKAMRLAFKRLKLDDIVARLRAPGGVNATTHAARSIAGSACAFSIITT